MNSATPRTHLRVITVTAALAIATALLANACSSSSNDDQGSAGASASGASGKGGASSGGNGSAGTSAHGGQTSNGDAGAAGTEEAGGEAGEPGAAGTTNHGGADNGGTTGHGGAGGTATISSGGAGNGGATTSGGTGSGGASHGGAGGGGTTSSGAGSGGTTSSGAGSGGTSHGGAGAGGSTAGAGGSTAGAGGSTAGAGGSTAGAGGSTAGAGGSTAGAGGSGSDPICSSNVPTSGDSPGVVWSDDFESSTALTGIEGTWQVNNAQAQAGSRSIQPPLEQTSTGGSEELAITCGGASHSELRFYYAGYGPTAAQTLKFYVDDALYWPIGNTAGNECCGLGWTKADIVVPSGKHRYRWVSTTDGANRPPFWIDSIQCLNTPVAANQSGRYEFEEGFRAPEIGGNFLVDNSQAQAGSFSAHPPRLSATQKATLNFSCGCTSHSELSFYYAGYGPTGGQPLKFYVDGLLYATLGNTAGNECCGLGWTKEDILLPQGPHQYRFESPTDVDGQPPYWIDTIRCQ